MEALFPARSVPAIVISQRTASDLKRIGLALGIGLALTTAHTLIVCALAGGSDLPTAYAKLSQMDSGWYASIVERGYYSPEVLTPGSVGNVAFFPGYPLFGRLMKNLTGLPTGLALPLAAQLACWGAWTYLFLFFQRLGYSLRSAAVGTLAIASQPAAFFLVVGYSESLFVFAMLGYLYWADRQDRRGDLLACAHGILMTGTRLVGLPLIVYPLARAVFCAKVPIRFRDVVGRLCWGAVAGMGGLLFFAFCCRRFGRWDLYFQTVNVGWGIRSNYLGIVSYKTYIINLFRARYGFIDSTWLDQVTVLSIIAFLVLVLRREWKLARSGVDSGWRKRAGYYLAACLLLFFNISARYEVRMLGMIRYAHCIEILLVLAMLQLLSRAPLAEGRRSAWAATALAVWIAFSFLCQLVYIYCFTHGLWVA